MFKRNPKVRKISRKRLPPYSNGLNYYLIFAAVYFYFMLPAFNPRPIFTSSWFSVLSFSVLYRCGQRYDQH
jgi:hypothetical protein